MKRENFKQAEQTLHQINSAEKLLAEVRDMIEKDNATDLKTISIEFRMEKDQIYIPIQYSQMATKFLVQLRKEIESDLSRLNYELSQL